MSQPVAVPGRKSPENEGNQLSPANSRPGSPSTSPASKRKREEETESDPYQGSETHPNKKRKTPPIESASQELETPRMGQIQKKVEQMKVNRMSGGPLSMDPIQDLAKVSSSSVPERDQDKDKDAADQPPATPPREQDNDKDENAEKPQEDEPQEKPEEIETDNEDTPPIADTEMGLPPRRRTNGLEKVIRDRPIEVDQQEYNRKRKASEKLAGSPFSSPAAKRTKEDNFSVKPTIVEEKVEQSVKSPSTPSSKPVLKGFSAFASVTSPFAMVRSENAPFGGVTRPSSLFDGAAPKFKSPFPSLSPFTTPKTSNGPSVFSSKAADSDPTQELAKETNTTPFPSSSGTPVFGTPSNVGTSAAPKSVFGRPSAFGVTASPAPSAVGPTRRAKSPRPHAFGAYGSTAGRFAAPSGKIRAKNKAEEDGEGKESDGGTSGEEKGDEEKPRTFSEILATTGSDAEHSDNEKMVFTEQETITGEEEEMNIFHGRGKLYVMDAGSWKERGPGLFKLNVNKTTGGSPRILMRRDGALTLLLNASLFKGMMFAAGTDPKYIQFTILDEELKPKSHLLRFNSPKLAQDLLDRIQGHIPT